MDRIEATYPEPDQAPDWRKRLIGLFALAILDHSAALTPRGLPILTVGGSDGTDSPAPDCEDGE